MSWFTRLFFRQQLYDELSKEIREHLEEKIEELVTGGLSRKEAAHAAQREFGNVTLIEEDSREVWQWPSVESFIMDIRYGARTLRKSPGFTFVIVLTLALGIGANTAIFSVVNAVLLRPLPFADSGRLVQLIEHDQKRGVDFDWVSFPNFQDWATHNQVFESMAAYKFHTFNLTNVSQPQVLFGAKVSANLLLTLGADPTGAFGTCWASSPGANLTVRLCRPVPIWTSWLADCSRNIQVRITTSGCASNRCLIKS